MPTVFAIGSRATMLLNDRQGTGTFGVVSEGGTCMQHHSISRIEQHELYRAESSSKKVKRCCIHSFQHFAHRKLLFSLLETTHQDARLQINSPTALYIILELALIW